jgi:hypothetical protein
MCGKIIRQYIVAPHKTEQSSRVGGFATWQLRGGIRTSAHVRECMAWAALDGSAELLKKLEHNLSAKDQGGAWCVFSELDDEDKEKVPEWSWMRWARCDASPTSKRILIGERITMYLVSFKYFSLPLILFVHMS